MSGACIDCKRFKELRRGLCSACYQRWQYNGRQLPPSAFRKAYPESSRWETCECGQGQRPAGSKRGCRECEAIDRQRYGHERRAS